MVKNFDFKTAFKQAKHRSGEDEKDVQRTSKRQAFHEFFRSNAAKLPTVKKAGKRKTQVCDAYSST